LGTAKDTCVLSGTEWDTRESAVVSLKG